MNNMKEVCGLHTSHCLDSTNGYELGSQHSMIPEMPRSVPLQSLSALFASQHIKQSSEAKKTLLT